MTAPRKATIDHVAALAGVSIKTVSRVLNGQPNVKGETRTKVKAAIEQLRYVPNLSARRLASRRTHILALLYDNPSANYLFGIQKGVLATCKARGYDLLVHPCDQKNPDIAEEVINLHEQGRCDGVVLTPPLSDLDNLVSALSEHGTPFILIAPAVECADAPWVVTTDEAAGYEITQHLIALGHSKIGFIKGHPDHKAMTKRELGYRRALRTAGLPLSAELVAQGFNTFESGQSAAKQLLSRSKPPSAVFAANDDMAAGVVYYANSVSMNVPGDLSVAGFDDTPVATETWPALTTIRQPIREMAESAARILIDRLDAADSAVSAETINARLVVRQSTGPARAVQATGRRTM